MSAIIIERWLLVARWIPSRTEEVLMMIGGCRRINQLMWQTIDLREKMKNHRRWQPDGGLVGLAMLKALGVFTNQSPLPPCGHGQWHGQMVAVVIPGMFLQIFRWSCTPAGDLLKYIQDLQATQRKFVL
jgi:hypothetical protein